MAESQVKKEIKRRLGKLSISHLATCERKQPRVRPMALIHKEGKFWMASDAKAAKVRQLKKNPRVEVCVPVMRWKQTGYIQITGKATEVKNRKERATIGNYSGFVDTYWKKGVDDPGFMLLRIKPTLMRYMRPGEMRVRKVKW